MRMYWNCLRKFADETGRATRRELIVFQLVNTVCFFVLLIVSDYFGLILRTDTFKWIENPTTSFWNQPSYPPIMYPLPTLYHTIMLIPTICVAIRRLHDTDRSGYWIFTFILFPVLLILLLLPGSPFVNRYGPNPRSGIDPTPDSELPGSTTDQPVPIEIPSNPS